jgi:hypothetical protein
MIEEQMREEEAEGKQTDSLQDIEDFKRDQDVKQLFKMAR